MHRAISNAPFYTSAARGAKGLVVLVPRAFTTLVNPHVAPRSPVSAPSLAISAPKAAHAARSTPGSSSATKNTMPTIATVMYREEGLKSHLADWASATRDRALYVMDVGVVERQVARWTTNLPEAHPHYAVKCNPDPVLINVLAAQGVNFDCASGEEMRLVLDAGVSADRIIFANPIKNLTDLTYARSHGIRRMTFDNADEVHKVAAVFPEAQLVLRLLTDDSGSLMRFGTKFGAPQDDVRELLALCKAKNMEVLGTSFHIGSGCFDVSKYTSAIELCRKAFDTAEELGLPPLKLVDVGGGFSGSEQPFQRKGNMPAFEEFAETISLAFKTYFPKAEFPHVEFISEPGRYFATAWGTLFTQIQGKRLVKQPDPEEKKFLYYINDGAYGSFNCKIWDHHNPVPVPVRSFFKDDVVAMPRNVMPVFEEKQMIGAAHFGSKAGQVKTTGTFFGPTCDSLDVVIKDHPIPELDVGDYLAFESMGAYTRSAGVPFNGCHLPHIQYIRSLSAQYSPRP